MIVCALFFPVMTTMVMVAQVLEVMASIESLNFVEMAMLIDVFKVREKLQYTPVITFVVFENRVSSGVVISAITLVP